MFSSTNLSLVSVVVSLIASLQCADAFAPPSTLTGSSPMTVLHAEQPSASRRAAIFGVVGVVGSTLVGNPEEASARYSSYAHREQDWQERSAAGEVNYKTAKDLRRELQEIAPMNTSKSKIFCPNGPSAAVSPLMENKCGDQLALPSVYGRTQDSVGNSIPGFATSYRSTDLSNVGGFLNY